LNPYLDALRAWEVVVAWTKSPGDVGIQKKVAYESFERNEGRLRHKAAQYCYDLAPDAEVAGRAAEAIMARRWSEADELLAHGPWKSAAANARIRWLDE
jgi:hypothetical protein